VSRLLLIAVLGVGCSRMAVADVPVRVPATPDAVLLRVPVVATPAASPAALRRSKAQALQYRHAFDAAINELDSLIEENPRDVDARLMRAQILVLQWRAKEAMRDCNAIQSQVSLQVFATCAAQVRAALGDPRGGYALVQVALHGVAAAGTDAVRSWSAGVAGELAQRLGDEAAAGRWYALAWRSDGDSHYARLNYADWLLAQKQYAAAADVVAGWQSAADLLRQVLAQRDAHGAVAARLQLAWREAAARGENTHLDRARFAWLLTGDQRGALALARAAFTQQPDPVSARWLFQMAQAQGDARALEDVERWRRRMGYVDQRLRRQES
jgi:tetratricopeptide (TPR) repeat protein